MTQVATRPRRKRNVEEHDNHERWAVSYADMMTVLVALFIVMYAISAVDSTKYEQLRESLARGFGNRVVTAPIVGSSGPLNGLETFQIAPDFSGVAGDTAEMLNPDVQMSEETITFLEAAQEYEQLVDIQTTLLETLQAQGLDSNVTFLVDERGLVVGLVGSDVFFAPDTAALTGVANQVIDTLSGPLRNQSRQISIEGHANVLPSQNFATNWELSSARATQVLRRFVEVGGIAGPAISATGYGDARPYASGMSDEALAQNRRVDIVIRSDASEEVRALLPKIAQALRDGSLTQEQLHAQIEAARAAEQGETL